MSDGDKNEKTLAPNMFPQSMALSRDKSAASGNTTAAATNHATPIHAGEQYFERLYKWMSKDPLSATYSIAYSLCNTAPLTTERLAAVLADVENLRGSGDKSRAAEQSANDGQDGTVAEIERTSRVKAFADDLYTVFWAPLDVTHACVSTLVSAFRDSAPFGEAAATNVSTVAALAPVGRRTSSSTQQLLARTVHASVDHDMYDRFIGAAANKGDGDDKSTTFAERLTRNPIGAYAIFQDALDNETKEYIEDAAEIPQRFSYAASKLVASEMARRQIEAKLRDFYANATHTIHVDPLIFASAPQDDNAFYWQGEKSALLWTLLHILASCCAIVNNSCAPMLLQFMNNLEFYIECGSCNAHWKTHEAARWKSMLRAAMTSTYASTPLPSAPTAVNPSFNGGIGDNDGRTLYNPYGDNGYENTAHSGVIGGGNDVTFVDGRVAELRLEREMCEAHNRVTARENGRAELTVAAMDNLTREYRTFVVNIARRACGLDVDVSSAVPDDEICKRPYELYAWANNMRHIYRLSGRDEEKENEEKRENRKELLLRAQRTMTV